MRNILLPTDFSQSSINAIFYALRLMRGTTCTFHFLSIYKAWKYTSGDLMLSCSDDSVYDCLLQENEGKLKKLIENIEKSFPGEDFDFETISSYNVFTDAINNLLEQHHFDFIVMGTDGSSNITEQIFGSHTLRVIRKVNAPLLVIPNGKKCMIPRNLLLSLNIDTNPEQVSFEALQKLIGNQSFSLDILKIASEDENPEEEASREQAVKQLFEIYNPKYHKVSGVPAHQAIQTFVETAKIDFHVLPVKKEDFLERVFGSQLAKIIYATKVPLLVLHEAEQEKPLPPRRRRKRSSAQLS
ncbi:MAG: universal stress protein [Salinimicrobium sp.]